MALPIETGPDVKRTEWAKAIQKGDDLMAESTLGGMAHEDIVECIASAHAFYAKASAIAAGEVFPWARRDEVVDVHAQNG